MNISIPREKQFGTFFTVLFHTLLVLFAIYYTINTNQERRASFIEVELGQFETGTLAEYSQERNQEVATRPDPSETPVEEPTPETPEPEEAQPEPSEETTKPVDLPDQQEEITDPEEIKTPDTEKIDPKPKSTEEPKEEVKVPPETRKEETVQEGAKESGDEKGLTGDVNADQGTGTDQNKAAPYELKWEGNIERAPQVQPLPDYTAEVEAVITVKFQVKPNGAVGRIIPLKKMNAELEKEVFRTLRNWRFSQLPSGVPQQTQWGIITFRFVLD